MTATRTARRITGRRLSYTTPWLRITQDMSDGTRSRTVYMVEAVPHATARVFDLTRSDADVGGGVRTYRVSLYRNGGCSCMREDGSPCPSFGYSRGACKHCCACRKIVELAK